MSQSPPRPPETQRPGAGKPVRSGWGSGCLTTATLGGRMLVTLVDIPEPPLAAVPLWGRADRSIRHGRQSPGLATATM